MVRGSSAAGREGGGGVGGGVNRKRGERVLVNGSGVAECVQSVICRHLNGALRQETGRDDNGGRKIPRIM